MLKEYKKKILRHPVTTNFITWLVATYLRFVYKTSSWTSIGTEHVEDIWEGKRPVLACFWHNRLAMMTFSWKSKDPFYMLSSSHPDGKIIAKAVQRLGIRSIWGSSSKGSTDALRKLLRALKEGKTIGITPDGPRGPRYSINSSTVAIAKKAGVDIQVATYSTSRRWLVPSWDSLIIPKPFGKGVFIYSEPIRTADLKTKEDIEKATVALKEKLIEISNKADEMCGQDIIPEKPKKAA